MSATEPGGPAVVEGWAPGLLGWIVAEHARYYAEHWRFGVFFEAKLAREVGAFAARLADPGNHIWHVADAEGPLATVTLDGGEAEDRLAHLRWFIAADRARGQGLGQILLDHATAAARADRADGVYLTTFAGLEAARRIYERAGFQLVHEAEDRTWGTLVREQRFELRF